MTSPQAPHSLSASGPFLQPEMTAVAVRYRDEILEQVRSGKILREIAPQYGVSPQAIHQGIQHDPEYREAMKTQAESMIGEAKEQTWAAREALDIARAREIARFAFRYAESVNPAVWGQKQEITHHQAPPSITIVVASVQQTGNGAVLQVEDNTSSQLALPNTIDSITHSP